MIEIQWWPVFYSIENFIKKYKLKEENIKKFISKIDVWDSSWKEYFDLLDFWYSIKEENIDENDLYILYCFSLELLKDIEIWKNIKKSSYKNLLISKKITFDTREFKIIWWFSYEELMNFKEKIIRFYETKIM